MRVLFAFPKKDQDLADEVNDRLRSYALEHELQFKPSRFASHLGTAMEIFAEDQFSHCVIHDDLPESWRAAPVSGGGFELATRIRQLKASSRTCILHNRKAWSTADAALIGKLDLQVNSSSEEGLAELLSWLADADVPVSTVDIVIELSKDLRNSRYRIVSPGGQVATTEGPLNLREAVLVPLKHLSKELDVEEKWETALQTLRTTLRDSLVDSHVEFKAALQMALQPRESLDNSRLLFRVQPEQYEVAFEAIQCPNDDSYWMLRAPVFRSLSVNASASGPSIFAGAERKPLNVLIIVAAAAGTCVYEDKSGSVLATVEYADLNKAPVVAETLGQVLQAARERRSPVGAFEFSPEAGAALTTAKLKDVLSRQVWDIVHFIGHTDFHGNRGFLILPGSRPSSPEAVGLEEFAPYLAQTRLVYLSSCYGTKLAFVERLAEHGVSSVLGYRTKVRDTLALEHTKYFYEKLFELKSIERAFFCARQYFHKHHPNDRLWACSSLIMQGRSNAA